MNIIFYVNVLFINNIRRVYYDNAENYNNDFINLNDEDRCVYLMKYEWKLVSNDIDKAWNGI